ncbi:copper homeostasis protein CutC [Kosakonia radicincitans DSM 16656]|uniref:copper homeostasis protein CutC n=1 Tax=Kosakonia TaxID=1330547 RepID=UPI00027307CC|nr:MULTISPECIES: copper homeostasis protein CutC [Kosakonia]ARD60310.1 copper homeostasis protein CutC [Kosakonia radicincitans DSM 16656]NCF07914.1 copper homeostasis protein CutC [Kosakonia sp. MH5]PTA91662.1 copper homeostasis protein CutC [Kosakonia sp. H7A]QEM91123.1 copper homeostasis protein CutC [Kosakonia radicincitans]SKC21177.1 copper homeostasis protein [Kosakonia radicincitans]
MALLEICCYGVDDAVIAQQQGADRIEFCAAPKEGGLTPSTGALKSVRQRVTIPVHPIVRPRGGDFCYRADEFAAMLEDIRLLRELGFPGLVTGVLNEDGQVDMPRMREIMSAAQGMAVTFHRAFDMCANPQQACDALAELGVVRILTSGQQASAEKGLSLIRELNARSGAPIIMAGAGVRPQNLEIFLAAGVKEVHSSAGRWFASPMRYRNSGLSMSSDAQADEYARYGVDGPAVAEMKQIIALHRP